MAVSAALLIPEAGRPLAAQLRTLDGFVPMTNWKPVLRLPREFFFDQLSKMICQNAFLKALDDFVQETAH
jgi:hypothetical protein